MPNDTSSPSSRSGSAPRRIPITCSPDALVVLGHVVADLLRDPRTPILADSRDTVRAGDLAELDIRCGHCRSREVIDADYDAVVVAIGHEPHCPRFAALLLHAVRADASGIAKFADELTAAGAVTGV